MANEYLDKTGLTHFWDNIKGEIGNASDAQVDDWLDRHPEATTTVQDGAISTAKLADGAVTDAKLAQTGGVLEEVSNLQNDFVKRDIPASSATANYTVSSQTGKVTSNNTYSLVEFNVLPSDKILYSTGHNETAAGLAFYDINGTFISGNAGTNGVQTITVPQNALSAKACFRTSEVASFYIKLCEYVYDLIGHLSNVEAISDAMQNVLITTRYLTSTWKHGSINSSGEETGSATYARSGYIKIPLNIEKGLKITLQKGTYSNSLSCYVYIYDDIDDYNSFFVLSIGATDITNKVSSGQYIRCVIRDGSTEIAISDVPSLITIQYDTINTDKTFMLENHPADAKAVGDAFDSLSELTCYEYAMTSILCIGDSLTRGSSPIEEWGVQTGTVPIWQSYPRTLGRMINCDVVNGGFSGISASTWYENWADEVTPTEDKPYQVPHYDFADFDTCIIWLGTNNGYDPDDLEVDGTEANYLCKIIEAIQTDYANGHTDERYSDHGLIVLVKVFATKSAYNLADTNDAIDAIATKYSLPVIDNSDLGYENHPEFHENVDNPHMGKAGYIYVANRICNKLRKWIAESPTRADFGETQFPFNPS